MGKEGVLNGLCVASCLRLANVAVDLIAALTWPIDVAQELKEMEDEGPTVTDYASLLRAQVEYKVSLHVWLCS